MYNQYFVNVTRGIGCFHDPIIESYTIDSIFNAYYQIMNPFCKLEINWRVRIVFILLM